MNKETDSADEELKKDIRMKYIYKALEDGWTVKKSSTSPRTFEFSKPSGSSKVDTIDEKHQTTRRSVSTPLEKKIVP